MGLSGRVLATRAPAATAPAPSVFVRQEPGPGKHHGAITNYLLRDEIAREARVAATEFADLSDEELLAREAELDQRWDGVREEHQRLYSERRKVKREKSRCGLFLPPLHDDDAEPDVSLSEKLKTALVESKKRRQRRL